MKDVMNFDDAVITAVTSHMNDDHIEDSMIVAKAFGYPEATASKMVGLDAHAGVWHVTDAAGEHELRVEWPGGEITERPQVRRQVVEIYKAACKKLGVSAREEHAPEASPHGHAGGNPHAHGGNPHAAAEPTDGPKPFSRVVREGSWTDHGSSEGASFMEDIMRGVATKQDYIDLVVQHYYMYEALEEAAVQIAADEAFAALHPEALIRRAALEADLEYLIGAEWREQISPVQASVDYAARIREIAAEGWVPGIFAHHYTRYLGDLSGGQIIAKRAARQHGFEKSGIEFYNFETLGDLAAFKETYRDGLDKLGETLSEDEQQRMVAEVRKAYAFNTEVFVDLAAQKAARG